mgnify:CR=1 FL=1
MQGTQKIGRVVPCVTSPASYSLKKLVDPPPDVPSTWMEKTVPVVPVSTFLSGAVVAVVCRINDGKSDILEFEEMAMCHLMRLFKMLIFLFEEQYLSFEMRYLFDQFLDLGIEFSIFEVSSVMSIR